MDYRMMKKVKIVEDHQQSTSMSTFRNLFNGGFSPGKTTLDTPERKEPLRPAIKPQTPQGILRPSSQNLSVRYLIEAGSNMGSSLGIPETSLTMALQRENIGLRQALKKAQSSTFFEQPSSSQSGHRYMKL